MANNNRIGVVCALEATLGGTRKYCVDYLSKLDANKFDVTFIYSLHRADAQFKKDISYLQSLGIRLKEIPMVREIRFIDDLRAFFKFIYYLRVLEYSIIHLHSSKAGFLGRLASRIVRPHAITIYHPHMLAHRLGRRYILLEKFAALFTDYIIAESQSEEKIIKECNLIPHEKIVTIPAGVNIDALAPYSNVSSFMIRNPIVIGTIGRLTYPKDPFTFIRAAKILIEQSMDAKFYWVGEGDLYTPAQQLIDQLGLHEIVSLLGWQNDSTAWIRTYDIFVHSSYYEAFGLAVAEAMALGKPVVASDISGVRDIVDNGITGYLYQPGNAEALASYIMMYAQDRRKAVECGAKGRKRILDNFTLTSTVEKITNLYMKAIAKD